MSLCFPLLRVVNPKGAPESCDPESGRRCGTYWSGCDMNWVLLHNLTDCRDPLDPPRETRPACWCCDDPADVCCSRRSLWAPLQLEAPKKMLGSVGGESGAGGAGGSLHKVGGTATTALHAAQHGGHTQ